jgi:uncharacterized membrane protein
MSQQFKCKEPGCDGTVEFEYAPTVATIKMASPIQSDEVEVVAYLTCNKGHTHPYNVKVPK